MKSRMLNCPNGSRGNCPSKEHLYKALMAIMKFWKLAFSVSSEAAPFPLAPLSLFLSYPVSGPCRACSLPCLFYSRNHHGFRIFSITQKFFHHYKSSRMAKRICTAFQMWVKWEELPPKSLMVKSEDCRENISIRNLVNITAPEKEDCFHWYWLAQGINVRARNFPLLLHKHLLIPLLVSCLGQIHKQGAP